MLYKYTCPTCNTILKNNRVDLLIIKTMNHSCNLKNKLKLYENYIADVFKYTPEEIGNYTCKLCNYCTDEVELAIRHAKENHVEE